MGLIRFKSVSGGLRWFAFQWVLGKIMGVLAAFSRDLKVVSVAFQGVSEGFCGFKPAFPGLNRGSCPASERYVLLDFRVIQGVVNSIYWFLVEWTEWKETTSMYNRGYSGLS